MTFFFFFYLLVVSIFLTNPLPLAWKGTPAVFFSCWAVSVAIKQMGLKRVKLDNQFLNWRTPDTDNLAGTVKRTQMHIFYPTPRSLPPIAVGRGVYWPLLNELTFLQQLCSQGCTLGLPLQLEMFDGRCEGSHQSSQCTFIQVLALQRKHGRRLALAHWGGRERWQC